MPDGRRSPRGSGSGRPPSGRRTTGRARGTASGRPAARPTSGPGRRPPAPRPRPGAAGQSPARARFTGRAAILVLVLAVLMISYASSMRAYLQQRHQILALQEQITASKQSIADLTREKKRWADPAYVRAMAHERLGWVLPGEISFQVIGKNGKPLGHHDTLPQDTSTDARPPIWWKSAWKSMEAAGNPPKKAATPKPATRIKPPQSKKQ